MISLDSFVYQEIMKKLTDEAATRSAALANGNAKSFEEYRHSVGYLRALADVGIWAKEVNDKLTGKRED